MGYLQNLWDTLLYSLPSVVIALILLVVAWFVAGIVKRIVVGALKKLKFDRFTEKAGITDEETGSSLEFLGKLVFLVVFLLFMPGVFDHLGMTSVSMPFADFVSKFLAFIPNIIAAAIIMWVGLFVADLVRKLLRPVLKRFHVDRIQEKAGIESDEQTAVSSVIAQLVYVLILVPVVIAALEALNITAISEPAIAMLQRIVAYLPNLFVAIAILIIGVIVARIAGKLLGEILAGVGTDQAVSKVLPEGSEVTEKFSLSKVIGEIVKYVIILLFVVEAIDVLRLGVLQFVGVAIISYLPNVIGAIVIMGVGLFLANGAQKVILSRSPKSRFVAFLAKGAILVLAIFMTLSQLGLAASIIQTAFIFLIGALAVAFAIAFGIGGRDFAKTMLRKVESNLEEEKKEE